MNKPFSSAARASLLPNRPASATTIAGELRHKVIADLECVVFPYIFERLSDGPRLELPQLLYQATVGVGKTGVIVEAVGKAIEKGLRVAIRVPTVSLGGEVAHRIEARFPQSCGVWLGRDQDDPNKSGHKMCPRIDAVRAAQALGTEPTKVCGNRKTGFCKYNPRSGTEAPCGYLKQDLSMKHVVIFAGDSMLCLAPRKGMKRAQGWKPYRLDPQRNEDLLGHEQDKVQPSKRAKTVAVPRDFDLLILDETDPLSFVIGFGDGTASQGFKPDKALLARAIKDETDKQILLGFLESLEQALAKCEGKGYVAPLKIGEIWWDTGNSLPSDLTALDPVKFMPSDWTADEYWDVLWCVRETAYDCFPRVEQQSRFSSMSAQEIMLANAKPLAILRQLKSIVRICEAMCLAIHHRLRHPKHLRIGSDGSGVVVRRVKEMSHHYRNLPLLVFDATPSIELLQSAFPRLRVEYARSAQDSCGVTRFQLRDRDLSYSTLKQESWPRRISVLAKLIAQAHGRTGIVLPITLRENVEQDLPSDVAVAHFGALRGLNAFETVKALIVVSRPAIHHRVAEDMAGVLSNRDTADLPSDARWYPRVEGHLVWREDPDAGWVVGHVKHPDPTVEAIRKSVTEAGLEQALGRGRNVRRSADRPLVEYILSTTPTDRVIDGTFTTAELKAVTSWVGEMLSRGIWIASGEKGGGEVLLALSRAYWSQRPDFQDKDLIGVPAFETKEEASDWRKKQRQDNVEIAALCADLDKALASGASSVELICTDYPLNDFTPLKAKARGSRYYATVYVRAQAGQTAADALASVLGPWYDELEVMDHGAA